MKAQFHCVWQASGSGPIFMINFSSAALRWGSVNAASTPYDLVWVVLEFPNNAAQQRHFHDPKDLVLVAVPDPS